METTDKPENLVEAKSLKRIHFAIEVEEHQPGYTPYKKAKKEINYGRMLNNVLNLLAKEKYSELDLYLNSHTTTEVEEFYKQFDKRLLKSALFYSDTSRALSFLLEKISFEAVINILNENKAGLVTQFIRVQNSLEKKGKLNASAIEENGEKIKILLALNNDELTTAIQTTVNQLEKHFSLPIFRQE